MKTKKRGKRKNKKNNIVMLRIVCLSAIGMIVLLCVGIGNWTRINDNMNKKKNQEVSFPYELEEGKIEILSLFQASVENPDCNNELGENTAALEIANKSEEYCQQIVVNVVIGDGTKLEFKASDIPPGKTVWAFEVNNLSLADDYVCVEVMGEAMYGENSFMEEKVSVSVADVAITIQNKTNEELTDILVKCHCLFDDVYFGGITYEYPVSSIPANGQIVVDAVDCFMGEAEVIGIIKNE